MDSAFKAGSELVGISSDQFKLIFCLLVAYPLGSLYVRIPYTSPGVRHLFSIAISSFFLLSVLHLYTGVAHLLASAVFTYVVAYTVRGPTMPWIVFAVVMGHLTINQVIRAWANIGYDTVEITGSQMVLTMKLTTFAWNVYDGQRKVADLDASQLATRIVSFPSPLAFLGYVFYFPGILVGPAVEYVYYEQLVSGALFAPNPNAAIKSERNRVPEGRKRVAYTKLLLALFFLGLYAVAGTNLDYDRVLEPAFLKKSLFGRIAFVQALGLAQRTKYYGVWLLTEGASILTGLGFNGYSKTGATLWNRTANVDIMNIEFAPNFKVLLDSWNINTNVWLRNCVYKRVTPKGKKPGFSSTMITFLTSAFWHGIYVGYYLSFFFGGFIQYANRLVRQYIRPFFLPTGPNAADAPPSFGKRLYDVAGVITSVMILNYAVAPFQLLDLKRSLLAWHRMSWYGHVIIGIPLIFFMNGGKRIVRAQLAKRGIIIPGGKGAPAGKSNGSSAPSTPGKLGGPNGFTLTVPPIDQGINGTAKELKKSE